MLPILLERMSTAPTAIQFEALWAITNIASGTSDQTAQVVPALPIIARLIRSPNQEVSEQAVWAVGNIAGDSTALRDSVLEAGALVSLVGILDQLALKAKQKISLLRNAVWTISNCCRGKPQPPLELVRPALPGLAKVIWEADAEVVADACWALSYLSDGPNERLQAVIDAGVLTQVVRFLGLSLLFPIAARVALISMLRAYLAGAAAGARGGERRHSGAAHGGQPCDR